MSNSLPQTLTDREKSLKINALIAEKVMGLVVREDGMTHCWVSRNGGPFVKDGTAWSLCPSYSTDISAAFQVVEKMHEQIYATNSADPFTKPSIWDRANYLTLSCLSGSNDYAAAFTHAHESDEWFEAPEIYGGARAATAPMAICLAALKALGVEIPS